MKSKFSITEKILEDEKKEILEIINSLYKVKLLYFEVKMETLLIKGQEFSEMFQKNKPELYSKIKLFDENKMLLGISAKDKVYLLDFFDRKAAYYESERTFHFIYGVKKGFTIYSDLMESIQNENAYENLSKFFGSEYLDVDVFEIYMSQYGKEYKLDEFIDAAECILESADISENEYRILSDYLLDTDYIACESKYLFEHGVSLGLKLAYSAANHCYYR